MCSIPGLETWSFAHLFGFEGLRVGEKPDAKPY